MEKKADLTIGKYALTTLRNKFMTSTTSYYSSPLIIVVPIGEPFTSLEKLTMPFRKSIWLLMMVVLIVAFFVITFIKWKLNEDAQSFILGFKNSSPYLNTFIVYLGGSLTHVPKRNFARTILCIFMLYCLVVRNSYTGALFNFIRSETRKPSVKTIHEMVAKDFKFYMIEQAESKIMEIKRLYMRRIIINTNEVPAIREKMVDPYFQGGLLSSLEQIVYFNKINRRNFTVIVCPERLFTFQYSIYLQKHSHLTHRIDGELSQYQTNGFITHVERQYVQERFMHPEKPQREPKALVMKQLFGSFLILGFGLLSAVVIGAIELFSVKFKFLKKFLASL